ncbi:MAG: hypothetical protein CSB44_01935 [Gammaproteobacteria bacterium]|nr:MAG: hypothetical protein CSB44_01935 [Gammaproteobacteria bacterium]
MDSAVGAVSAGSAAPFFDAIICSSDRELSFTCSECHSAASFVKTLIFTPLLFFQSPRFEPATSIVLVVAFTVFTLAPALLVDSLLLFALLIGLA